MDTVHLRIAKSKDLVIYGSLICCVSVRSGLVWTLEEPAGLYVLLICWYRIAFVFAYLSWLQNKVCKGSKNSLAVVCGFYTTPK